MKTQSLAINFFDLVLVIVLVAGLYRGRRRGMSTELLDLVQWLLTVFCSGLYYKPVGENFRAFTGFPLMISYMLGYLVILLLILLVFTFVRRLAGEKLVGSDLFGSWEYYLGMTAGMVRFGCVLFVCLAFLNAELITDAEYRAQVKADMDLYGGQYFFRLGSIQRSVFRESLTGPFIVKHLGQYLIEPTHSGDIMSAREGFGKRKEREMEDLIKDGRRR